MAKATADTRLYISLPRHGVVLRIMQYAARVSLSDCFCPMGQRDRGFENPRLFKDRPTDGKEAAALHLLYINVCNSVGNRAFLNLRRHGVSHYFAVAITGTQYPATAFLQNRPHAIPHPNFCKPMPPRSVGRPRNSQGALAPPESLPGRRARPSGRPRRHLAGGHKKSPARTVRLGRGGNGRRPTLPPYEGQYHRRGRA